MMAEVGRSVRFRVTATAAAVTAVVLLIASVALVLFQRNYLVDYIDQGLSQRASDIESLLEGRGFVAVLPSTTAEGFAQIVGQGRVQAATENLIVEGPLELPVPETDDLYLTSPVPVVDDDLFRILARPIGDGSVIYVGSTFDVVGESTAALVGSLAVLIPLVVTVLAILTWWLVGRTLRPVEAIRSEVAGIGFRELDRRVPDLLAHGLDGDPRLRHDRPARAGELRHRPRPLFRLRLRPRSRPRGDEQVRHPEHPLPVRERRAVAAPGAGLAPWRSSFRG